jgi:hypothetical protein
MVRLPSKTLRECGHHFSSAMCRFRCKSLCRFFNLISRADILDIRLATEGVFTGEGALRGPLLARYSRTIFASKYPPAKPGALVLEPLKAAYPCRTSQASLPLCGMLHAS